MLALALTALLSLMESDSICTYEPYTGDKYLEYYVLRTLYDSTSGDDWKRKDYWLSSSVSSCENWYGIRCRSNSESVIEIYLKSNNLQR